MKASLKRRDYHEYVWSKKEFIFVMLQAVTVVIFFSYFFYRSIWAVIPLSTVGVGYVLLKKDQKKRRCKEELLLQFRECILSVSASLKAGYAVENAFLESREDMGMLFGEQSMIYKELELIRRGLVINITLEEQLLDLAERSDCEEILQFSQILSIAKRNGGDIPEIIGASADLIGQKIEVKQEINTMLSGRQMEQNIMKLMPFVIITYIETSYRGYFDVLYHNLQGVGIMTVCLFIYLAAYVLGEKMMQRIVKEVL